MARKTQKFNFEASIVELEKLVEKMENPTSGPLRARYRGDYAHFFFQGFEITFFPQIFFLLFK